MWNDWMFSKTRHMCARMQRVFTSVECSKTTHYVRVKYSSKKSWLTSKDEKTHEVVTNRKLGSATRKVKLNLSSCGFGKPVETIETLNDCIELHDRPSYVLSRPMLKCTKRWLPNLPWEVLDIPKRQTFTMCKWVFNWIKKNHVCLREQPEHTYTTNSEYIYR